jgi:hypothetical protein
MTPSLPYRTRFCSWVPKALLLTMGLLVAACAATAPHFDRAMQLERGAPVQDEVRTMDYVLYYRYVFQEREGGAGELSFTGDLEPRPGLDVLDIRLHLLDERNVVLATHLLRAPGVFAGVGAATLRERIPVPPGTVFIAFSHYGREDTRRILRDDDRRRWRW